MEQLVPVASIYVPLFIILHVGTVLLGSSISDCTTIPDYNEDGVTEADKHSGAWSGQCYKNSQFAKAGIVGIYVVMGVSLIPLALYIRNAN